MGIWDRVRALFTRDASSASGGELAGRAIPDQSIWLSFQRIGGHLTPAQVSEIIRVADSGFTWRLCDLGNEMRQKDGHLHATLETREGALATLPWELYYPGQEPDSKKGAKEKDFVLAALRNHPGLRPLFAHLQGGIFNGYAVAETIWKVCNGYLLPDRFVHHSPRRFGFRQEDSAFVWRDVTMSQTGIEFQKDFPDKFIVSMPRVNGDVPVREGLIRCLMWLALFRNWTMGDWLKLAEISWKPWRMGKYSKAKDASREDRQGLEALLSNMSSSGVCVYPDTTDVELKWPEGKANGGGDHSTLFDTAGREMSKAVLGQTLTTEQGKVGSQALGKVHNEVRMDRRDADAAHIAAVITNCLIEPMVRLNFGTGHPIPCLRFVTEESADTLAFAQGLQLLVGKDIGLKISAEWVRDKLGIPEPAEDDELLGVWVDMSELDEDPANDPTKADAKPAAAAA